MPIYARSSLDVNSACGSHSGVHSAPPVGVRIAQKSHVTLGCEEDKIRFLQGQSLHIRAETPGAEEPASRTDTGFNEMRAVLIGVLPL